MLPWVRWCWRGEGCPPRGGEEGGEQDEEEEDEGGEGGRSVRG